MSTELINNNLDNKQRLNASAKLETKIKHLIVELEESIENDSEFRWEDTIDKNFLSAHCTGLLMIFISINYIYVK